MTALNIVFAGTPEFAANHLKALIESNHSLLGVYTQPDRPAGRGKKLSPSAVKSLALEHDLPVFQPASLKHEDAQAELAALKPDLMVVVAYGLLLPKAVLDIPRYGCINVHGSILPRWRGAAPIQRAIEAGDSISGVTIMQMDVGLDTGDMLLKSECPIHSTDTTVDLHDRLCEIGPPALLETITQIAKGTTQPVKQDNTLSNYAQKIEKAEAEIHWQQPAGIIDRKIRAFNPFPICYSLLNGERLKIHKAHIVESLRFGEPGTMRIDQDQLLVQCQDTALALEKVQLPGKKATDIKEFLNGFGHLITPDTQLGTS